MQNIKVPNFTFMLFVCVYVCLFLNRQNLPQFRQQFASATLTGMSPTEFAKKLLNLWVGRLVEVFFDGDGNEEEIIRVANNNSCQLPLPTAAIVVASAPTSLLESATVS